MAENTKNIKIKKLNPASLALFFEQMYMFLQNGITVWESLSVMSENCEDERERKLYTLMHDYVLDGFSLSKTMEVCGCFPEYAIGMCKIGEQTGRMDETVAALRTYYAEKDALSQSIKSAVAYPLCMAGMVLTVVFVLIIQVMPVFQQVFAQLGLELNPFAATLLSAGQALNNYALVILVVFCAVLIGFIVLSKIPFGKSLLANFFDTFPLTKKLSGARAANSFAFSTSLMLGSGIETLTAFEFAEKLAESKKAKRKINDMQEELLKGKALSDVLIESTIFSVSYSGMIIAGTRVGSTDEMLMSIARRYHTETEQRTQRLLSIIEPALVAVLCTMVGMVMLSVMLPLMGILSGMQV